MFRVTFFILVEYFITFWSSEFLSILTQHKSGRDLEMEMSLGRYLLKQQNNGQHSKKAPIGYLFFFYLEWPLD